MMIMIILLINDTGIYSLFDMKCIGYVMISLHTNLMNV